MPTINEQHLENLLHQVEHLSTPHLEAGLTIISKDLSEYFAANGMKNEAIIGFQEVYSDTLNEERESFMSEHELRFTMGKLSAIEKELNLPHSLSLTDQAYETTRSGTPDMPQDLTPLTDPNIEHEFFTEPGKRFLKKFGKKFKEVICGKGGPYEQFTKGDGLLDQANLPVKIAAAILATGLTGAFWYPLAIYLGLLITKTGLKTYCEVE